MSAKVLVDTNVLVYAYDSSESAKQAAAFEVLDQLQTQRLGVLSSQVLGEFFVAVTRRITSPISVADAYDRLMVYASSWQVLGVTPSIVLEAARGVRDHRLSFWDSQLWATAKQNEVPLILSEDCNPGAILEGVRYLDPFSPEFSLSAHVRY